MRRVGDGPRLLGLAVLATLSCMGAETDAALASAGGSRAVTSVVDHGAVPNDAADDTVAVARAIKACGASSSKTLHFPGGTFNLATITFPAALNVVIAPGTLLDVASDAVVTFNGPFTAGLCRVFSDSGRAQFGNAALKEVYPQWWGSSTAADASPAIAINKAISAAPLLAGINVRVSGTLTCQTTIRVNRDRVSLIGDGMYATKLLFNPATPLPLVEFTEPTPGVTAANWGTAQPSPCPWVPGCRTR